MEPVPHLMRDLEIIRSEAASHRAIGVMSGRKKLSEQAQRSEFFFRSRDEE